MSQIDTLRTLLAAATPGDWQATRSTRYGTENPSAEISVVGTRTIYVGGRMERGDDNPRPGEAMANAELAAAAVTSLPALLAVAEAAQRISAGLSTARLVAANKDIQHHSAVLARLVAEAVEREETK